MRNITYLIITISALASFFSCDDDNWISISEERIYSISGVSAFNNGWLVVHDNKMFDQPRISLLSKENQSVIDSLTFSEQTTDVSMGRDPNNVSQWIFFENPTPGSQNN